MSHAIQEQDKALKKRKENQRARTRACFKCKENCHLIAACPILEGEVRSDQTGHPRPVRPVGVLAAQPHSFNSKQVKDTIVIPKWKQV